MERLGRRRFAPLPSKKRVEMTRDDEKMVPASRTQISS